MTLISSVVTDNRKLFLPLLANYIITLTHTTQMATFLIQVNNQEVVSCGLASHNEYVHGDESNHKPTKPTRTAREREREINVKIWISFWPRHAQLDTHEYY